MLGWDAKRAGFASVSFGRGLNLSGFLRHPTLNRVSPTDMNYMTYRDEKRESNRIESGLGRQVKAALRIS